MTTSEPLSLVLYHSLVLQKGRMKIDVPSADFQASLSACFRIPWEIHRCALIFDPFLRSRELVLSIPSGSTSNGCRPTLIISRTEKAALSIRDNGDVDFLMEKITQLGLPEPMVFHEVFFHFEIAAHAYYRHVMRWTDRYRLFGYHCDPQYAPADNTLPLVANHPEYLF